MRNQIPGWHRDWYKSVEQNSVSSDSWTDPRWSSWFCCTADQYRSALDNSWRSETATTQSDSHTNWPTSDWSNAGKRWLQLFGFYYYQDSNIEVGWSFRWTIRFWQLWKCGCFGSESHLNGGILSKLLREQSLCLASLWNKPLSQLVSVQNFLWRNDLLIWSFLTNLPN